MPAPPARPSALTQQSRFASRGQSNRRLPLRRACGRTTDMAKLYFHYSTMNAGKSTLLLQASYNYHERGMQTYLLTIC